MRKIIEYTLVSVDGVFAGPALQQFLGYRDDAYLRDGLGLLLACDAMLMGRTTYDSFATIWPGRDHPWAGRLNAIPKYVFSSTLERAGWNNSTIVRGDVVTEVTKLKQQQGGDLLIYCHGRLAETLLNQHLLDMLDISIHPPCGRIGKAALPPGPEHDHETYRSQRILENTQAHLRASVPSLTSGRQEPLPPSVRAIFRCSCPMDHQTADRS